LFQIGPLKAPGLDGFPARFFQTNWDLLKDDVIKGVKQFFSSSHMPEGVNDTVIVLIPKNKEAQRLHTYQFVQRHIQGGLKMFGKQTPSHLE